MTVRILVGDVREQLRALPSEHFDCVVTSPPYWGLRCYGVEGQIGLEPSLGEHLAVMVGVFREVRRVLKRRGTLWLNYGDCYAAAPNGRPAADVVGDDRAFRDKPFSTVGPVLERGHSAGRGQRGDVFRTRSALPPSGRVVAGGYLKPKDLCMIANRLAIALQDDGWWVRSEIIWHKPNPMPESVYDRPTSAHEKVWLLTKDEDYFYNHEAIREPVTGGAHARARALGTDTGVGWGRLDRLDPDQPDRGRNRVKAPGPNSRQNVDRVPRSRKPGVTPKAAGEDTNIKAKGSFLASVTQTVETRNARNVWTIAPKAFKEAHFATFPPALAERCIKAGVPAKACGLCGHDLPTECRGMCEVLPALRGHVLDPFGGAGTVGLVADGLGLDATLIELNPEYAEMAARRIGSSAVVIGATATPLLSAAE